MKEVVDMFFKRVEVPSYHLPGVVFETWLLEELPIEFIVALLRLYLFQQACVVAVWVPKEDGVVVQHIGLGVIVRSPIDRDATGAYSVEYFFGDVALDGGVLGTDVELILLEELGFVVVVFCLQLVGVV